jgi:hypothetical protein
VAVPPETTHFCPAPVGAPEGELKALLTNQFQRDRNVEAAYLVSVTVENSAQPVMVIAVKANLQFGPEQLRTVGHIAASTLSLHKQVKIVLLSLSMEKQIAGVCKPFFERDS